jgi:hypothetical protein
MPDIALDVLIAVLAVAVVAGVVVAAASDAVVASQARFAARHGRHVRAVSDLLAVQLGSLHTADQVAHVVAAARTQRPALTIDAVACDDGGVDLTVAGESCWRKVGPVRLCVVRARHERHVDHIVRHGWGAIDGDGPMPS